MVEDLNCCLVAMVNWLNVNKLTLKLEKKEIMLARKDEVSEVLREFN